MRKASAVIVTLALTQSPLFSQAPPRLIVFEVASVKRAEDLIGPPGAIKTTGSKVLISAGQVRYSGLTLKALLVRAYGMNADQISGPSWIDTERYDVVAKIPAGGSVEQVPVMLQALLLERFKMQVHRQEKRQRVYELVPGRNGHHLKPSAERAEAGTPVAGGPALANQVSFSPDGSVELIGSTLPAFTNTLSKFLSCPVLDMTGIQGVFDIKLNISLADLSALRNPPLGTERTLDSDGVVPDNPAQSSIYRAVEELGLKLESRIAAVGHLIVDHAARIPSEN